MLPIKHSDQTWNLILNWNSRAVIELSKNIEHNIAVAKREGHVCDVSQELANDWQIFVDDAQDGLHVTFRIVNH